MEPMVLEPLVLEMASHVAMARMQLRKAPLAGVEAGAGAGPAALSVMQFLRLLVSNWVWNQLRLLQLQTHQPEGPLNLRSHFHLQTHQPQGPLNLRSHLLQFHFRSHHLQ